MRFIKLNNCAEFGLLAVMVVQKAAMLSICDVAVADLALLIAAGNLPGAAYCGSSSEAVQAEYLYMVALRID